MMLPDKDPIKLALSCKCPRCREGDLYEGRFGLTLRRKCEACGLDLSKSDSADGPAVFLSFILGFLLVPLAFVIEFTLAPPLWVHAVVAGVLGLAIILGTLRPIKAYVIALQFKHRASDWD